MSKPNMSNKNTNGKKEFAPSVGFWPAKSDSSKYTVYVDENIKAQLAKAEVGGRLLLSRTPDDRREKNPNIPHFNVTIFAPDEQANAGKARSNDDSL